jgi:hypothetical protein
LEVPFVSRSDGQRSLGKGHDGPRQAEPFHRTQ